MAAHEPPACAALTAREILRVLKLWTQTIAAPVISSFLFIVVFGLSLGGRIKQIDGVDYEVFIVPGPASRWRWSRRRTPTTPRRSSRRASTATSTTCSPRRMRAWEVNLGLSLGGVVRALLIGVALGCVAIPLIVDVPVREPLVLVARRGARARCCSPRSA